jgi:hypothetical protein
LDHLLPLETTCGNVQWGRSVHPHFQRVGLELQVCLNRLGLNYMHEVLHWRRLAVNCGIDSVERFTKKGVWVAGMDACGRRAGRKLFFVDDKI